MSFLFVPVGYRLCLLEIRVLPEHDLHYSFNAQT